MTCRHLFWSILLIGMGLRVAWALAVPVMPVSDAAAYHQFARTLVEHGVYGWEADNPTAYWAVGTSALAAFTYLFTDGFEGIVILNLLAGLMILVLVFQLAGRWFGARTALWALALVAFWPNLIMFTTILSSELFFIAMMLAGLSFWQRPAGHWLLNLLAAGLLWGLTAYIRPVILLVPVALALVDLVGGPRRFAMSLARAGGVILIILAITLPWSMRNEEVFGTRVTVSTNFGPNFWMGNNPDSEGGYMPLPPEVRGMGEIERGEYLKAEAKTFMKDNPLEAAKLMLRKLVRLNARETIGAAWNEPGLLPLVGESGLQALKLMATGYWYLLLGAGLAGIAVLAREGLSAAFFNPPVALWGYFTSLHVLVVAEDRYHMPSSPFIAIMAAVTFVAIVRRLGAQRSGNAQYG